MYQLYMPSFGIGVSVILLALLKKFFLLPKLKSTLQAQSKLFLLKHLVLSANDHNFGVL